MRRAVAVCVFSLFASIAAVQDSAACYFCGARGCREVRCGAGYEDCSSETDCQSRAGCITSCNEAGGHCSKEDGCAAGTEEQVVAVGNVPNGRFLHASGASLGLPLRACLAEPPTSNDRLGHQGPRIHADRFARVRKR